MHDISVVYTVANLRKIELLHSINCRITIATKPGYHMATFGQV